MEVLSLTNIFDNATGLTIGDKEVASIKIGTATIYEKGDSGSTIEFTITDSSNVPVAGYNVRLYVGSTVKYTSEASASDGTGVLNDVENGEYTVYVILSGTSKNFKFSGGSYNIDHDITISGNATWEIILMS